MSSSRSLATRLFFVRDLEAGQRPCHHAKGDRDPRLLLPGVAKALQCPVCSGADQLSEALRLIRFDLERSSRPGLGRQVAGLLPLALVALDAGGADTEALGDRVDGSSFHVKGRDDTFSNGPHPVIRSGRSFGPIP